LFVATVGILAVQADKKLFLVFSRVCCRTSRSSLKYLSDIYSSRGVLSLVLPAIDLEKFLLPVERRKEDEGGLAVIGSLDPVKRVCDCDFVAVDCVYCVVQCRERCKNEIILAIGIGDHNVSVTWEGVHADTLLVQNFLYTQANSMKGAVRSMSVQPIRGFFCTVRKDARDPLLRAGFLA